MSATAKTIESGRNLPADATGQLAKVKVGVKKRWRELEDPPAGLSAKEAGQWKAKRGYELEKLLFRLWTAEGLKPEKPYRTEGEQIDGLLEWNGRFLLTESRWQEEGVPASEIYAFMGKVQGKLTGTLGLFLSATGYTQDAKKALVTGKVLQIILWDGDDLKYCLDGRYSFRQILEAKMRMAAQEGNVFYRFKSHLDEVKMP